MAQVLIQRVIDDLDGSDITDDAAGGRVVFALQGSRYEIDLSAQNYAGLEAALLPFMEAAFQVRGAKGSARSTAKSGRRSRTTTSASGTTTAARRRRSLKRPSKAADAQRRAQIRAWARENGYPVSERGRVNGDIVAAYEAAQ